MAENLQTTGNILISASDGGRLQQDEYSAVSVINRHICRYIRILRQNAL